MTAGFVHLRVHSEYSVQDGLVRVKALAKSCAENGIPAAALTDLDNVFGLVRFYKAAHEAGVQPIVGAEMTVQSRQDAKHRIVLLCQNQTGYRNLSRLLTRAYLENRNGPALNLAWLEGATDGLVALSAGLDGDIGAALAAENTERARRAAEALSRLFPDRFYIEVSRIGRDGEERYIRHAAALAADMGLPIVATNVVCFLHPKEFEAHEARVCIQQGRLLSDPTRPRVYTEQQYFRAPWEMVALFEDLPEALENTVEIAKRCSLELELGRPVLPAYPTPKSMPAGEYLAQLAREGLARRLERIIKPGTPDPEAKRKVYEERLETELDVIIKMGFPGYFLIVADFIRWAKDNGIPVGPGRGSGAGSLVAYALGITDLDPLAYDLLFERFLNPERVSMPDFDVDFCMEGRDRVIDYVVKKYGRERVSQIITLGTTAARAALRDAARVLGYPYSLGDRLAKLVPAEPGMTLEKALEDSPELKAEYDQDGEGRAVITLAFSLEGIVRNTGKHAGGVVIAPSSLTDFCPLYESESGVVVQFDMIDAEAVGLVKFDFLGLRTLTVIDWALQEINRRRIEQGQPALQLDAIPLDDPDTFALLRGGATTAVFQLESRGMQELIRRLQPDTFEDLIALVALFRPGPLQSGMVDDFINRKHGRAKIDYPHPDLEPILKPTYGVILYQEQVMQIAQVLAGYTLGGADLLRRAMGKKKPEEMAKQRSIFLEGATRRGVDEAVANYIFDLMEKFAGYGFNKSHSAAYALLAYQTAWLKAHFPAEFMAAVLSSNRDNTDDVVVTIDECRRMGLTVAAPDVNRSNMRFAVTADGRVSYGLGAIKGVGSSALAALLSAREKGLYQDLYDLCRRVDLRKVNRKVLETLVRAGALDALGPNRATLMQWLPDALQAGEQYQRDAKAGQDDLFGALCAGSPAAARRDGVVAEWGVRERLAGERDALGLYLTGHPLDEHRGELSQVITARLAEIVAEDRAASDSDAPVGIKPSASNEIHVITGLVAEARRIATRNGTMVILTLDDGSGRIDAVVFPDLYQRCQQFLKKDTIVVIKGAAGLDDYTGRTRITADDVYDIETVREVFKGTLEIVLEAAHRNDREFKRRVKDALTPYLGGACPVQVRYRDAMEDPIVVEWKVTGTDTLLAAIGRVVGTDNVRFMYR